MIRRLHRYLALPAGALLLVLLVSGVLLSAFPVLNAMQTGPAAPGQSVAGLAAKVKNTLPDVQQIKQEPSGRVVAYYFAGLAPAAKVIDPATGAVTGDAVKSATENWLVDLHRSLFLGTRGRIAAGVGAAIMVLLALVGTLLLARRMGGWRRILMPARGPLSQRLHVEVGRMALVGLVLSGVTGVWMSLGVFGIVTVNDPTPVFPAQVSGSIAQDIAALPGLADIQLGDLKTLTFPYEGDPTDVFTVETTQGTGYVDQGTGQMLAFETVSGLAKVNALIHAVHTGRGLWLVGMLLGLSALGGAMLSLTGTLIWLRSGKGARSLKGFDRAGAAQTIVLVGSEGGSTWGFATTLGRALKDAGQSVHIAPMSAFKPKRWGKTERLIVLAASYGDGDAPASAKGFEAAVARTGAAARPIPFTVLGFGDRAYERFCGYADRAQAALEGAGWPQFAPPEQIDRQSPQQFNQWGRAVGAAMGLSLDLTHVPSHPATTELKLIARQDFGQEFQEPTAILRFALPRRSLPQRLMGRGWPRFRAGDLLGIVPVGDTLPRLYSLASSSSDGFVEICVKKHAGGRCSAQLHGLGIGDTVRAFVRPNPDFAPQPRGPVVLIGAGTGIGPLAGFLRADRRKGRMHLYFGARHPQADLLYGDQFEGWKRSGKLGSLSLAFSRLGDKVYVQDLLRRDGGAMARLARDGAQFMVCGGRDMAEGVRSALEEALAPVGMTPASLKAEGRYVEDVY